MELTERGSEDVNRIQLALDRTQQ